MNKTCSKCKQEKSYLDFYRQNRSKDKLGAWCKQCKKLDNRFWTLRNKESELERIRDWYFFNKDKKKAKNKEWQTLNKGKVNAITAKRRAAKLKATPNWLTAQNNKEIRSLYEEARKLTDKTGIPHQVDHLIPLQGRDVCGLHVPWNLQILTKYENLVKGTSLEVILKSN